MQLCYVQTCAPRAGPHLPRKRSGRGVAAGSAAAEARVSKRHAGSAADADLDLARPGSLAPRQTAVPVPAAWPAPAAAATRPAPGATAAAEWQQQPLRQPPLPPGNSSIQPLLQLDQVPMYSSSDFAVAQALFVQPGMYLGGVGAALSLQARLFPFQFLH